MSTKQEGISDAAFKALPFSSNFNFAFKDGQFTTATDKYCPLVVSPTIINCCKGFHLKYEFLDLSLKMLPCAKTSTVSCENQFFSYCFEMLPPLLKIIAFLCCFHYLVSMDPVNGCSKSKLLVKE